MRSISTLVATIIGTLAALAMQRYRFPGYNASETVMYIPIVIPEVVMGISLLVFFVMMNLTLGLGDHHACRISRSTFPLWRWSCGHACMATTMRLTRPRWTWAQTK